MPNIQQQLLFKFENDEQIRQFFVGIFKIGRIRGLLFGIGKRDIFRRCHGHDSFEGCDEGGA